MKLDIGSKSLNKISKQKKNAFVWAGLVMIVVAFIIAIYNGIDMESAIKVNQALNKKLENPDISDANKSEADTKIAWAIDIENTIDDIEEKQKKEMALMVDKTKKEIIAGNGVILDEITRTTKIVQGKIGELKDENTNLKKEILALKTKAEHDKEALEKKLETQRSNFENILEDGVMLPPPPMTGTPSQTDDGLFTKIDIVQQAKKTTTRIRKQEFLITSFNNEFVDENLTDPDELTEEEIKALNTYEIVTGFTDAYLLTGAYVPLFGDSSGGLGSTPENVPVLIETNGDLLMPNKTIGSIDKCFLLGISTGNAGARSVEIRLDKLTCLVEDGKKVLQGEIDGYVVSETGSPGLPATMIYKAGDFISRMIGAGILEGLSTAVVNYAANSNRDSIGGTTVLSDSMTGAGNGMNNAFTKLADFYLQLAEATIPILEVKPGRFISVVLVGGNKFELKDINLLDTREINAYIDDFIGDE